MTFLKLEQVDILLLESQSSKVTLQYIKFNNIITKVMSIDEELTQNIRQTLSNDPQIDSYLKYLADDIMSRNDDVIEYLKLFSLHKNDLMLHDELIYILNDYNIKLKILNSCHDFKISGYLR